MCFRRLSAVIKKALTIFVFVLTRPFAATLRVRGRRWIIGGTRDTEIEENSWRFFEYVTKHHPEIDIAFISRRKFAIQRAREIGGKAYDNYSLTGLYYVMTAEVYVYSLSTMDVRMVDAGKTLLVNLFHGAPLKRIIYDARSSKIVPDNSPERRQWWNPVIPHCDADLITTISEFFVPFTQSAFRSKKVKVLGFPRNDCLVSFANDKGYLEELKRRINCSGRKVVTYMPTHRNYGKVTPPVLFKDRELELERVFGSDWVFMTKQHPLSATEQVGQLGDRVFCLPHGVLSAQETLLVSDILITDYSSAFIDYLLLARPVLFYCYDLDEVGTDDFYFFDDSSLPGPVSKSDVDLLHDLKEVMNGSWRERLVECRAKFHAFYDNGSSERICREIMKMTGEESF